MTVADLAEYLMHIQKASLSWSIKFQPTWMNKIMCYKNMFHKITQFNTGKCLIQ